MKLPLCLTAAAISLTFLQLGLVGHHVTAATVSGCEGGQAEGDKWFDGCRWCVCENSAPVCSSSSCSEFNAQLPACKQVGSRWWDGCYRCTCLSDGIECKADRTCVALIKTQRFSTMLAHLLSQGACLKPQDNRCVCGVDGVPSCTADAIDRNALHATTISLLPSSHIPSAWQQNLRRMRAQRRPSLSIRRPISSVSRSRGSRFSRPSSRPRSRSRSRLQGRRSSLRRESRYRSRRAAIDPQALKQYSSIHAQIYARRVENSRKKRCVGCSDEEELLLARREIRSADPTIPTLSVNIEKSPSLLVSADNRCRWGSRWYGGGLRCYCDLTGTITCGDPRFVASEIDGFLMDRTPCEEGQKWEERDSCRYCECHVSGVALCWRAASCPYPYLIEPVTPAVSQSTGDRSGNPWDTAYPDSEPGIMMATHEEDLPGSGDDSNGMLVSAYRPIRPPPGPFESSARASTIVIVRQCKPGRKWRDGCLRCECVGQGRKQCDDRFCLKAPSRANPSISLDPEISNNEGNDSGTFRGRPIQIPPSNWSSQRERPLPTMRPKLQTSCGEFSLNEVYFIDACNKCKCLPTGPKCTALSC